METSEYLKRQDVLGLALDIHGAHTGSFPDLGDAELKFARDFLKARLDNWAETGASTRLFDTAVKTVLAVAVQEANMTLEFRANWAKV
jgi:hypothetical protein